MRDLSEACAFDQPYALPKMYYKVYYSISAAIHLRTGRALPGRTAPHHRGSAQEATSRRGNRPTRTRTIQVPKSPGPLKLRFVLIKKNMLIKY